MFRSDHRAEDVATRIDHLMEAVFGGDDRARLESLDRHLAATFVYISPEAVFEGPAGLSDAFALYRRPGRRPASLQRTSPVDLHHGYFRYSWRRVERGRTAMEGWSFGVLDESGAIARVVTFEGLVPGQPAPAGPASRGQTGAADEG
jgi:hypothetical protein